MHEAEELHALQLEVEALRKNQVQVREQQARAPPAPIMVPSSTLYMIDGSPKQRALAEAQAAEGENKEFQAERKEKEQEVEELRRLKFEVESLQASMVQSKKAEAVAEIVQAKAEVAAEEMRQAESLRESQVLKQKAEAEAEVAQADDKHHMELRAELEEETHAE